MNYINPMTGTALSGFPVITMRGRSIPDLRGIVRAFVSHDEYANSDPYPKDAEREERILAYSRNIVLPLLPELNDKPFRILDAGCGTGDWLSAILAESNGSHQIDVAEYSQQALMHCLDRNIDIDNACLFDANFMPFPPETYDVILAINLFEHITAPVLFLERLVACLKPGGVALVTTPSRYTFKHLLHAAIGHKKRLIHENHVTEYSVGQMTEMVRFVGGRVTGTSGSALVVPGEGLRFLTRLLAPLTQKVITDIVHSHHLMHRTVYYRIEPSSQTQN
ncbi:MAG: class I SAM-dependent methyltransferase [Candidatus Zixiibacteriota bacterium]